MADTLLFRGGNTADVNSSTVADREIVIDTQTNTVVLGSAKQRVVMNGGTQPVVLNGNVDIGSNISLNTNGSAEFKGSITSNRSSDGYAFEADYNNNLRSSADIFVVVFTLHPLELLWS